MSIMITYFDISNPTLIIKRSCNFLNTLERPQSFTLLKSINLEEKKIFLMFNVGMIFILVLGLIIGYLQFPNAINTDILLIKNYRVFMLGHSVMIIAHELIHGLFIKITSGFKVEYGFTLSYAYAGNKSAYFNKKSYIAIALSPFIVLGIFFQMSLIFLRTTYFWLFYLLQLFNLAGALGDFYVTYLTLKMPNDVLINDHGTKMNFYSEIDA